jgi:hypothetical protein
MVCIPTYGPHSTVEDYKREIQAAQACGIDGFALNCGEWDKSYYKQRSQLIYKAAEQLDSGFKLFFSADFATTLTLDDMADMVETFRNHPNQFKVDGKPVLSTFRGGTKGAAEFVQQTFQGDRAVVFVPFFHPQPPMENPGIKGVGQVYERFPSVDGFFHFGAAGTPDAVLRTNHLAARQWKDSGKIFMAGITPFYLGAGPNFRVFEYRGFEGMAKLWEGAISDGTDWVEITTWNDWAEASYIAPSASAEEAATRKMPWWGNMIDHSAYLKASTYYIQWFKSGLPPVIERDAIHYFYRLFPKALATHAGPPAAANPSRPLNADTLEDRIFVTTFLREPADLTIHSGDHKARFHLPAGVNHVSISFAAGQPRFVLQRNGVTVLDHTGERAIATPDAGDMHVSFNYFTGTAYTQDQ